MERLNRETVKAAAGNLPAEALVTLDVVESTNDLAKSLGRTGAAHGTAVLAQRQTAGRGRMGRSFLSPEGGIYLSLLLRPKCRGEDLLNLTALLAVCACDAVEEVCSIRPKTKWVNDLVLGNKKLAGILTEPSFRADGSVDFVVCGIGMNVRKPEGGFHPEIRDMAVALDEVQEEKTDLNALAGRLIFHLSRVFSKDAAMLMAQYRKDCATVGKPVKILREDTETLGFAETVKEDGSLLVRKEDGTAEAVFFGEVSVRGLYGYL